MFLILFDIYTCVDIENILRSMNSHLPSSRRTLAEHIESGDHSYSAKNGHTIMIEEEEICLLESVCTDMERIRLRLPMYISTDTSAENAWKVEGIIETSVISKILNRKPNREDMIRFYYPDLKMLRQRLPNAVSVMYLP